MVAVWRNKVQIYKPYFLVFIRLCEAYAANNHRYTKQGSRTAYGTAVSRDTHPSELNPLDSL